MDQEKGRQEYIRLRLKLARDKIKVAEILYRNSKYRDAISRAYYAVYYAARAFLLSEGKDPTTHKGVDILLHRFCEVKHRPSINAAKILSLMRQARLDADYKEKARITKDDTQEAIAMAKSFLREIKSLIKTA